MKRIIFFAVLTLVLGSYLSAQNVWEGTAVTGRYGDFPPSGYYGASNIFPRNSLINVQNIANGKIVQIIISGGLDDPYLFLVLSRQAADELEMERSDTANVRVSQAASAGDPIIAQGFSDLPYSDDPDINPAARAGDAGLETDGGLPAETADAFVPPPEDAPAPAAGDTPEETVPAIITDSEPESAEDTPEGTEPAIIADSEPEPAEDTPEEAPSVSARVPAAAGDGFDVEDNPFVELPEEMPPAPAAGEPGIADDWIARDVDAAERPAGDSGLIAGDLPVPAEDTPAPDETTGTETIITLEPAAPKPPAEDAGALESIIAAIPETPAGASKDGEWARANLPLVNTLSGKSYYLQVASYRNPERVKPLVDFFVDSFPVYPVVVLDSGAADPFYHVMVGPLKEDERGLLLRQIRAKGFRDAFLKENK